MKKVDFNKLQAGDLVEVPRTQFAPMRRGWNGWLFSEAVVIRKGVGRKSKKNVVVVEMRTPAGKNSYGTIEATFYAENVFTTPAAKNARNILKKYGIEDAESFYKWVNEGAGSDKQKKNIAKDGMITFAYHKLRCAVAVSLEVDTMAISAFETLLINNIVEAMTKALEQAIIDGNGTGKPKGILAETPADGQTIESAAPSYSDLIKAEGALPMAYENGAVWCMSKKTFMEYVGMTDKNGQPIAKVNYGTSGKPERTLLGRTVVLCDYVASYSAALAKDTIFTAFYYQRGRKADKGILLPPVQQLGAWHK